MAPNRITRGGATPRALAPLLAALALAALLAGCGGGSSSTAATMPGGSTEVAAKGKRGDESADAAALNAVLGRQEAAIDAYAAAIPHLAPGNARTASYFRAQEQEHVDGVVKVMRGAGVTAEPKAETIDPGERKTEAEWLVFLYEVENATIEAELTAISGVEEVSSRLLLASTVANQAQHLTLLRRALGTGPLGSIPGPFENGTADPPR